MRQWALIAIRSAKRNCADLSTPLCYRRSVLKKTLHL
jgi:hypothetical protein